MQLYDIDDLAAPLYRIVVPTTKLLESYDFVIENIQNNFLVRRHLDVNGEYKLLLTMEYFFEDHRDATLFKLAFG